MGQIARQLANGFRDILLGIRPKDIGKNDIDAPFDYGEVNPLFKTAPSSEGEERLIKEGQTFDPYTAESKFIYPVAEGFPVQPEYIPYEGRTKFNIPPDEDTFEPKFFSGSKAENITRYEAMTQLTDEGDLGYQYDFQRFSPEQDNPYFSPNVVNPRINSPSTIAGQSGIEVASKELMPFYSTIESSLRSLNIKNEGMSGKKIKQKLKSIKKYNEEEAAFIGFNLDDNTIYSNTDLNKILEDKGIIATANIKTRSDTDKLKNEVNDNSVLFPRPDEWSYSAYQGQPLTNIVDEPDAKKQTQLLNSYVNITEPSDKFELSININPVFSLGSETYEGRLKYITENIRKGHQINSEKGPTLAHARGSVYTKTDGTKEIIMDEFQTDALSRLKGSDAIGYGNINKTPEKGEELAFSEREGDVLKDALMLGDPIPGAGTPGRRDYITPEEQAELDTRTPFMVRQPYYGRYSDLTPSEVMFLRNESPKDAVKMEYLYLLETNWEKEIGLKGPVGNTKTPVGNLELFDQTLTTEQSSLKVNEQLDIINKFLYDATPKYTKDIKRKDGSIVANKGDQVTLETLDIIVDEDITKNIDMSFFKFDKKSGTPFNMNKDFPLRYLLKAADPKYKHTREIKTISLETIKGQRQGPLDKRRYERQVKVKNPGFVERRLPIPTGRYSGPERYLEKLLQSLIVYAKREGIDTIHIPAPFDIGRERGIRFLRSSFLKDTYIVPMDRVLKNITKEEPKIKIKRRQRSDPWLGRKEAFERRLDLEGYTEDDLDEMLAQDLLDDDLLDPDIVQLEGDLLEEADMNTITIGEMAGGEPPVRRNRPKYLPTTEESIWNKSSPRMKEIVSIDLKGLKLDNIEGLKGRYSRGGLVTTPSSTGLMSR